MKLIKRNHLQPALPTFFDDFLTNNFFGMDRDLEVFKSTPAVNISEHDEHWEIQVAAPGLKKEDFKLELDNNLLTISFEKKEESETTGKFTRREFSYSSFKRSFTLPEGTIDSNNIEAQYTDGLLTLTLPKNEEVKNKPKRTIQIG